MFNRDKNQKEKLENLKLKNEEKTREQKHDVEQGKKEEKDTIMQIKKSELDNLKNDLEEFKAKSQEYFDRFLRLQAEFDNAKKRMQRQQQEFIKYADEGIILELLGILDDLERSVEARETNHQDPEAFLKGVEMILSHLYEMLKKHDVRSIEAKGKIFDPTQHEALMQTESDEFPENTVIEELQKGYLLGDRIIRTAKVKVSKQKETIQENKKLDNNKEVK
ncbi:MAG: nucleotide exchange factor GrpE [Candidatus Omnitrophica bacterium]|nr:nucleotide exchange factor GrpE [Candidatus Omnitrophota bacterium]